MTKARAIAAGGGAFVLCALFPLFASDFALSLAMSCLMYAGLASAWSMFCGATRYLSLGTSAFFGLGAYFCAWSLGTLPWPIVIAGGALTAAAAAALAGLAILHLRGTYFAVLTFGLSELTRHAITYGEKQYAGTVGRLLITTPSNDTVYWTVLAVTAIAIGMAASVRASRFGLALRAIGMDEQRAETLGVATRPMKIAGFALYAAVAGALGAAVAVRWTYVDPPTVFNPLIGFQTVLIAMVGGATSFTGPIISALVFSLLAEFLRLQFPYVYMIILGLLLILAVLYLPRGLAGLGDRARPRGTR